MMLYDAKKEQTKHILAQSGIAYPSEYVIRIFKGSYPRLSLDKEALRGKRICDVGCGDGRNMVLLQECGFEVYGVEISEEIVRKVRENLKDFGVRASNIKVGTNDKIPFEDCYFDYLLSWNACYYMGDKRDFQDYVKEFARVTRKDGYLILSIPKKTCFIFRGSDPVKAGYQIIRNDPWGVRNGEVLRMFDDELEIEQAFGKYFKDFVHGSVEDDCFGYAYHWFLVVCRRR